MSAPPAAPAERESTGPLTAPGLQAAARTDCGPVRRVNEDTYVCRPERGLFAVIDGMGGHQGGRIAAGLMREALLDDADPAHAVASANERILARARSEPSLAGMGCVVSAVRLDTATAHVAHVGDTRVYLASGAGCEQLTRDHTVAAHRQEELGISDRRAKDLDGQHQVTRDVGGRERSGDAWIDRLEVSLEPHDLLVLCSDGVHGAVPREELVALLRRARQEDVSPEALVEALVERALACGTRDNATAVVVRWLKPAGRGSRSGEPWIRRIWRGTVV